MQASWKWLCMQSALIRSWPWGASRYPVLANPKIPTYFWHIRRVRWAELEPFQLVEIIGRLVQVSITRRVMPRPTREFTPVSALPVLSDTVFRLFIIRRPPRSVVSLAHDLQTQVVETVRDMSERVRLRCAEIPLAHEEMDAFLFADVRRASGIGGGENYVDNLRGSASCGSH